MFLTRWVYTPSWGEGGPCFPADQRQTGLHSADWGAEEAHWGRSEGTLKPFVTHVLMQCAHLSDIIYCLHQAWLLYFLQKILCIHLLFNVSVLGLQFHSVKLYIAKRDKERFSKASVPRTTTMLSTCLILNMSWVTVRHQLLNNRMWLFFKVSSCNVT